MPTVMRSSGVTVVTPDTLEVAGEAADCRRVRPSVVIDHDDQVWRLKVCDLVERLVCHAAGQSEAGHREREVLDSLAGELARVLVADYQRDVELRRDLLRNLRQPTRARVEPRQPRVPVRAASGLR